MSKIAHHQLNVTTNSIFLKTRPYETAREHHISFKQQTDMSIIALSMHINHLWKLTCTLQWLIAK